MTWTESTPGYYGFVHTTPTTSESDDYQPPGLVREVTLDAGSGPTTQPILVALDFSGFVIGENNRIFASAWDGVQQSPPTTFSEVLAGPQGADADGGVLPRLAGARRLRRRA